MRRKWIAATAIVACMTVTTAGICFMAGRAEAADEETKTADEETEAVTMQKEEPLMGSDPSTWSPFIECKDLDEAEALAGFSISVPEKVDSYDKMDIDVMRSSRMIQVQLRKDEWHYITIRKAKATSDISGDYNTYKEKKELSVGGRDVTLKGNDGVYSLAIWQDGDYRYAVGIYDAITYQNEGVSDEAFARILEEIR